MTDRINLKVKRLPHGEGLPLPEYQTAHAAGMDLMAAVGDALVIKPGHRQLVPTGLAIELPEGYEAQVRPRSGLAIKHGIGILNSPGTIDADYRGEVGVILINHGSEPFTVNRGERIAQMVIGRVFQAETVVTDELNGSKRGEGGFGHTGRGSEPSRL